jgi:hypothetical protein
MRSKNSEHLELEIRLGTFSQDHHFTPGFHHTQRQIIQKALDRFRTNGTKLKDWTTLPELNYIVSEYGDNIRTIVNPGSPLKTQKKKKLVTLDLTTDRSHGFRICLSEEMDLTEHTHPDIFTMIKKQAPLSVRFVQRASFLTRIPMDTSDLRVQYDISKVSTGANKLECTKQPASYHCEIELKGHLHKLGNEEQEVYDNQFIANQLLCYAKALLGSYRKDDKNVYHALPQPKVFFLNEHWEKEIVKEK